MVKNRTENPPSRTSITRVFLLDDHEIFRAGLRTVLQYAPDIEVVGEANRGADVFDNVEAAAPDLLLLGIPPEDSPGELLSNLKERFPGLRIVALTGQDPGQAVGGSMKFLDGGIKKESSGDFLRAAIKMVALGGSVWEPGAAQPVSASPPSPPIAALDLRLSPREKRLLELIAGGSTNRQISQEFDLAEITVKKALQRLFAKLGVSNRTQAAMKATVEGLV